MIVNMKGQHRGIIIAGLGAVGRAVLTLGGEVLDTFDEIFLIDRRDSVEDGLLPGKARMLRGDITDSAFLSEALEKIGKPALFVNLCAGIDNVRIRRMVGQHDIAYLDSCCC